MFLSVECSQMFQDRYFPVTETKQEKETQFRPRITEEQTRTTLGSWRIHTTAELWWRLHMSWKVKALRVFRDAMNVLCPAWDVLAMERVKPPKDQRHAERRAKLHTVSSRIFGMQCFPVQNSCNERKIVYKRFYIPNHR